MIDKVEEFVLKHIQKKGKIPADIDIYSFNYIDTGYIDSMGIIKFIVMIESEFNISISEEDIESPDFRTIGGIIKIIKKKIEAS
ncbi:MAG: acyl carrier protein [Ignavibacteriaceae bacterium]|nr:acyl carrier protein [Ignavibacteriaceae bacterium]